MPTNFESLILQEAPDAVVVMSPADKVIHWAKGTEAVFGYSSTEAVNRSIAIRDITERKYIERSLHEKNVELEYANLAKNCFPTTMLHELRTPLNALIGFTGTLLMRLPGPLAVDQGKQLKTIQSSVKHLLSLINDLLDLAKKIDATSTRRFEGTGLGLYLSQKLANLIGGQLSFQSRFGKGCSFVLLFKWRH